MVEQEQQLLEKIEIDRELPRPSGNLSGNLWQGGKVAPQQGVTITTESEALPAAADLLHAPDRKNGESQKLLERFVIAASWNAVCFALAGR
jgi:hypothetical protein